MSHRADVLDHQGAQGLLHQRAFRRAARSAGGRRHRPHRAAATRSTASPANPRQGKTSLIKTLAGAIRPPMRVVGGSVTFDFGGRTIDVYREPAAMKAVRWRHLSYIMQGSMNVLNPVRRVKHSFRDFAARHMGLDARRLPGAGRGASRKAAAQPRRAARPFRTSFRAACASASRSRSRPSASPSSSSPTSRPPRSTCWCSRTCSALIKEVQSRIGSSVVFVTHDMSVHAAIADRLGIMYAGRLVEEGPTQAICSTSRSIPTPRT